MGQRLWLLQHVEIVSRALVAEEKVEATLACSKRADGLACADSVAQRRAAAPSANPVWIWIKVAKILLSEPRISGAR